MRTAALADWPHQMRLVEIRDEDNGFVTLTMIALDFSTENDALAADGRARGVADRTTGWVGDGAGLVSDRNVRLWIAAP